MNSDLVAGDVGILVLFLVAGVVGVGAGVEAWWHYAMCRVSHPLLR